MSFTWSDDVRGRLGRGLFHATHDLSSDERFSDAGLADLLDRYPRERLGIFAFPKHREGRIVPAYGRADGVTGEDLLAAVKRGNIWLNLRAASDEVDGYDRLRDDLFDSLSDASGMRTFQRDLGVLISSPNVEVHYHLDIPLVVLAHVRGRKRMWVYPTGPEFAADEHIEAIALHEQEEDLPFQSRFDEHATVIDLEPGMAVTWPQTAPHRVENQDVLNVSLSCEFMTVPAWMHAREIHANGLLRRRTPLTPRRAASVGPAVIAKAAFSKAFAATLEREVPEHVTAPTFRIDEQAEDGVAALG